MSNYLDKFPRIQYNVDGNTFNHRKLLTNVTFRIKIAEYIKRNKFSYWPVEISDEDTLELLAYRFYDDEELHWVIALANDMIDAQYDWPLNYRNFTKYIIGKYKEEAGAWVEVNLLNSGNNYSANDYITFTGGSGQLQSNSSITVDNNGAIASTIKFYGYGYEVGDNVTPVIVTSTGTNANVSVTITERTDQQVLDYTEWKIHRYEKVITRYTEQNLTTDVIVIEIDKTQYDSLPQYSFEQIQLADGDTVDQTIETRIIYVQDYERDLNDTKRIKKLIKREYIPRIIDEFNRIVEEA